MSAMDDKNQDQLQKIGGPYLDPMLEEADRQGHGNETRAAGTIAAVGAVAGSLVGGPVGAMVGGGLGALVGSAVGRGLDQQGD